MSLSYNKIPKEGTLRNGIDLSQVVNIVVAVVPLIVVVAILKMLMNLFKGFG